MISQILVFRALQLILVVTNLVLSLLCLLAGSEAGYLQNVDILTVGRESLSPLSMLTVEQLNTSAIRNFSTEIASPSGLGSFGNIDSIIENGLNSVADEIDNGIQIYDFYTIYLLDYCKV